MSSTEAVPAAVEPSLPGYVAAIEAEADDYNDNDSTLGSDAVSSSASIGSSILAHRLENGRTYHAYKDGAYMAPNDDTESDRLDLQHHLCTLTFDNQLIVAPIPKDQILHRVLDIGTGTGVWAMDFADEHPESQVLGCDLSPIQPGFAPPNLQFEIDDIEANWEYHTKFDFVHSRMMTGGIGNWPRLFKQAFDNIVPGGWMQASDPVCRLRCLDGTMSDDSPYFKFWNYINEGTEKVGKTCDNAHLYKSHMEAAGFENVTQVVYTWPTNQWPRDNKLKELGMWQLANIGDNLEGISLAVFTRVLGWTKEELLAFLVDVRNDMHDTKVHSFIPVFVVYGQKPRETVGV